MDAQIKIEEAKFWMVWRRGGKKPAVRHDSATDAWTEAHRLSGLNPGMEFFVLEATAKITTPAVSA